MIRGRTPCSQLCGRQEQSRWSKPEKANARAVAIRELVSASLLHKHESGQPLLLGEAHISPEASTRRRGWTLRGVRRQRAQKEPSGTWETRHSSPAKRPGQRSKGSHNLWAGGAAVS